MFYNVHHSDKICSSKSIICTLYSKIIDFLFRTSCAFADACTTTLRFQGFFNGEKTPQLSYFVFHHAASFVSSNSHCSEKIFGRYFVSFKKYLQPRGLLKNSFFPETPALVLLTCSKDTGPIFT